MTNQNSKCCEKCTGERNPTMMCQNIFCSCHTISKSEAQILDEVSELPKDFWDKQKVDAFNSITLPRTRLENWEEKSLFETRLAIFIDFVEKEANRIDEERRGAHRKDGGRKMQSILFLKSFISTLLQEERGKTEHLSKQIDRLANWIMENMPGYIKAEGAVDTAIEIMWRYKDLLK